MSFPHAKNKYSHEKYVKEFSELTETQKYEVWHTIINSAMTPNEKVNQIARNMSYGGKALTMLMIACVVYKILHAKNKITEAEKQSAVFF